MRRFRCLSALPCALVLGALPTMSSCAGGAIGGEPPPGTVSGGGGFGAGIGGSVAGGMPGTGSGPREIGPGEYLPPRIRRLTNAEYDASVAALLGVASNHAQTFAPDTRQSDFTVNAGQRVDPVYAGQLQQAARDLAKQAVPLLVGTLGCADGDACAQKLIDSVAPRAFRRPISAVERSDLLAVFQSGATAATFSDGVELVLTAILLAPSFLYLTELGDNPPASNGVVTLGAYETAAAISFGLTGAPSDQTLRDAAATGKLATPAEREAQARRLLTAGGTRSRVQRLLKEWLGVDLLEETGKDNTVYPMFDGLRPSMAAETDAFINEVVFNDEATVTKLLSADYTLVDAALGNFYGLTGTAATQRVNLLGSSRRGLLMQAGFLAVHGNDHESSPVKRGATILKKVLCVALPTPAELKLMVVPPKPDPTLTTRQRFDVHATDPACAACHDMIDGIGFALENFDGMGGQRIMENGRPIDTSATLHGPLTGVVKDGVEMIGKVVASEDSSYCFARHFYRFAVGQTGQSIEDRFLADVWLKLPPALRPNVKELLVGLAASELFVTRKVP